MEQTSTAPLKKTALHARHCALKARMVAFGGWEMPLEYTGIAAEHLAVRERAGLFDVSHMGEIEVAGRDALAAVQRISCNDASKLAVGQAQYSGLLTAQGTFVDDLLVYRARCCNPIRGEEIVGYVTRGKGVAVHSKSCPNVDNLMYEAERRIEVEWADATAELTYRTRLIIYAVDRPGILNELTGIVSGENVNIASIETRETNKPEQLAIIELTMELEDVSQFDRIVAAMRRLRDVREVTRSHRN